MLLKHPRTAWLDQESVDRQWEALHYLRRPDFARAVDEYDRFASALGDLGIDLAYLPADGTTGLDSIYVRDASVVTDRGVVLCAMGKAARDGEPAAHAAHFRAVAEPVLGAVTAPGRLEGGDVVWLDRRTLAVGRGDRTNDEGVRQLRGFVGDEIDEVIVVPLPHGRGPTDVFHLMSMLSPLDRDLALVCSPLLPVPFRETLLSRGIELVEVAPEELDGQAGNVLAVAPRTVLMLEGNPVTRARLEARGVEVHTFAGAEISLKGSGGPTCLTRPLLRDTAD